MTKPQLINIPADEVFEYNEEDSHAIKKIKPEGTFKASHIGDPPNGEKIELAYRFYADTD